ncbi:MAG: thioesterase family protein [Acidimicrobiales bacterium]|nr:thioesterase family protein [Acidimicrobiales bacterium]
MELRDILTLTDHGPDTFVGSGPRYPWGGLYGGQIVAQALLASATTVDPGLDVHSVRAYFIRRGDHDQPVRYEVDRIRDGRSFCTRRVVARQAVGAILNLEASFQAHEDGPDLENVAPPVGLPRPDEVESGSWSPVFERRFVPADLLGDTDRSGAGRAAAWLKVLEEVGDDRLRNAVALAYLSDDLPTDAVVRAHPLGREPHEVLEKVMFSASLDHTIWFHRPMRADAWHLHDFTCQTFVGGRGLATGHVFTEEGTHVATIAQEVLLRDNRARR